jgi:hypothetical protein
MQTIWTFITVILIIKTRREEVILWKSKVRKQMDPAEKRRLICLSD